MKMAGLFYPARKVLDSSYHALHELEQEMETTQSSLSRFEVKIVYVGVVIFHSATTFPIDQTLQV